MFISGSTLAVFFVMAIIIVVAMERYPHRSRPPRGATKRPSFFGLGEGLIKDWSKGAIGEKQVALRLRRGLPEEYLILNDVYLPLPDGTTTQIDHVVVSQYGVFVVETKNYSGWIFADEKSAQWTQTLRNKKSRFQNPMRQNFRHICALAENLGIDRSYFHGVVVFSNNCTFKTDIPDGVVYVSGVVEFVRRFTTTRIKPIQVPEVESVIRAWQATVTEEEKFSHVDNLKKRHAGVNVGDNPLCPYCGGEMILRNRKKDGKAFYGCKSYPSCKGIVNIAAQDLH